MSIFVALAACALPAIISHTAGGWTHKYTSSFSIKDMPSLAGKVALVTGECACQREKTQARVHVRARAHTHTHTPSSTGDARTALNAPCGHYGGGMWIRMYLRVPRQESPRYYTPQCTMCVCGGGGSHVCVCVLYDMYVHTHVICVCLRGSTQYVSGACHRHTRGVIESQRGCAYVCMYVCIIYVPLYIYTLRPHLSTHYFAM